MSSREAIGLWLFGISVGWLFGIEFMLLGTSPKVLFFVGVSLMAVGMWMTTEGDRRE